MDDLLDQFLAEEATPHVRGLLAHAIADVSATRARFELNRFDITVDREASVVVIVDVLDATGAGVQRVPLATFAQALAGRSVAP